MVFILYFLVLVFGLVIPLLISFFAIFNMMGDLFGAPYVATSAKMVDEILAAGQLKKGQVFYELGSGDGRIVRRAVKKYGVYGIGIDIHPMLTFYSKAVARLQHLKNINFLTGNFFKLDLKDAQVIFLFLMPKTLVKLRLKFLKECKKGTLIISHGFKIKDWEKYLVKTIDRELFPTYYYRI